MRNKKEPLCPECDSDLILSRYMGNYTKVQFYCGKCFAESGWRNSEVEDRAVYEWAVGKAKMDKWRAKWKEQEKADREYKKLKAMEDKKC